jgi:hypothetical protein
MQKPVILGRFCCHPEERSDRRIWSGTFSPQGTQRVEPRRENLSFERTGGPRFVILIRLLAEKNLVLVFDLSIHDSRFTGLALPVDR